MIHIKDKIVQSRFFLPFEYLKQINKGNLII